MNLKEMTLVIAREHLGIKEKTGRNDGTFVEKLQLWASGVFARKIAPWLERAPWCVMFATYCIHEAAKRLGVKPEIPREVSTSRLYAWYKKRGKILSQPEPYCVGMMRGGPTGHKHTFLVGGPDPIDGAYVWSIDGNWKNAVTRTKHRISDCDFGPIF